ncbi:hypothetical protein MUN82_01885 [Hymenobacter aerilatus]|uniref:Uncharacterized protein n=1 Tax=Hymenobacter aerilatus TaxID=2932251 RepID=A0A8T9SWT3_9BACT|nr:hypothetical protein [Hymenobacter aerilatus]UOR05861.1 hypothetical protein MUN82_01885 [Hymenobacter aerilatus]
MPEVTAKTIFLGNEGMWQVGETKEVSILRAKELVKHGLVIEKVVEAPKASTSTSKSAKKTRLKAENRETKPKNVQDIEQK